MGTSKGKSGSAGKAKKAAPAKSTSASKAAAKPKAAAKTAKAKPAAKKKVATKPTPAPKKPAAKKPAVKKVIAKKALVKKASAKSAPVKKTSAKKPVAAKKAMPKVAVSKKSIAPKKPAAKSAPAAKKPAPQKKATLTTKPIVAKTLAAKAAGKKPPPTPVNNPTPVSTALSINRTKSPGIKAVAVQAQPKSSVNNTKTRSATKYKPATGNEPAITVEDGRYALPASVDIKLPVGYKPDPKEEYMNPRHLEYFRTKLRTWRADLVEESKQTIENLRDEVRDVGDEAERATRETENSLELRTRDRYRKLISKIDKALKRIEEGHYGYCEETEEEIGLDRLDARPIATLSLDAQERWEHRQKQMGD